MRISLLLVTVVCIGTVANASDTQAAYRISSGIIHYRLQGEGMVQNDINWTMSGQSTYCFEKGGEEGYEEIDISEKLEGALAYYAKKHLKKHTVGDRIDVADYQKKRIMTRYVSRADVEPEGMQFIGQQMVANVICDMWQDEHRSLCLYKGFVLRQTYRYYGFSYLKEAVDTRFSSESMEDTNSSCRSMPDFPVLKQVALMGVGAEPTSRYTGQMIFELFESYIKQEVHTSSKDPKKEEQKSNAFHKELSRLLLKPQKDSFSTLLKILEKTRLCLIQAEGTVSANACLSDLYHLERLLKGSTKRQIVTSWSEEKNDVLERFESNIGLLRAKMPCIRRAKKLVDLEVCIRQ
jgi:hypothetical protein